MSYHNTQEKRLEKNMTQTNSTASESSDANFFTEFDETPESKDQQPLDLSATTSQQEEYAASETLVHEVEESESEEAKDETPSDENTKAGDVKELDETDVKAAEQASISRAEEVKRDEEQVFPVIDDSYESLEKCQVTITYSLLPLNGEPGSLAERDVIVAVFDHDDEPIINMCKVKDLGVLPQIVTEMLEQLKATLPLRAAAYADDKKKQKEEAEKRKARMSKSKSTAKTVSTKSPSAPSSTKTPAVDSAGHQIDLFDDLMGNSK